MPTLDNLEMMPDGEKPGGGGGRMRRLVAGEAGRGPLRSGSDPELQATNASFNDPQFSVTVSLGISDFAFFLGLNCQRTFTIFHRPSIFAKCR